jgi:hypothetical protein
LCPSEDEYDSEDEVDDDDDGDANNSRKNVRSLTHVGDIASPTSFPTTPFSRAKVVNRNAEKVISTIFSARDVLRLEMLSTSNDEYSRNAAVAAKMSKKMAVFDPSQTSEGLSLACGNHCLMKAGKGLCYSSRSMLPLRADAAYIYYEFSVTATNNHTPVVLSLGFSSAESPLSTMVGSSALSLGVRVLLYYCSSFFTCL